MSLIAIATLLGLGFCEWGLNRYLENFADTETFLHYASFGQIVERVEQQGQKLRFSPHRYLGYIPTPDYRSGENRHNALGFRGDEIELDKKPGEFRIVAMGGSTTYTGYLDDYRKSYPALLENELHERGFSNATVINAGADAYGSLESMISLQLRVLELNPDLVIIYHGINDVHPRLVWPPEARRSDDRACKPAQFGFEMLSRATWEEFALLRIPLVALGRLESHGSLGMLLGNLQVAGYSRQCFSEEFLRQKKGGSYPSGIFGEVSALDMLDANSVDLFEQNLRSMIGISRAHDIQPVLQTFVYSDQFPEYVRTSSETYRRALDEGNEMVRQLAQREQVPLLDMAERLPRDRKYYLDGRHSTEAGAALRGQIVAEFLIAQKLVPKPARTAE